MSEPDALADLDAAIAGTERIVAGIRPGQWVLPTPCAGVDVRAMVGHLVTGNLVFAAMATGSAPPGQDADHLGDDPLGAFRAAAARLRAALRVPGLATTTYTLPFGQVPGTALVGIRLTEHLGHGWDLARATGQDWSPPAAAAEESLAFAPGMLTPDYQGEGKAFGPPVPVPAAAPAFDRLLGLSGRDPGWRTPAAAGPLIARFQVDGFEPRQVSGLEGDWVSVLAFAKTFTAGITGKATTLFMSAGTEEGSRSYVATERITGRTAGGREGGLTIQHGGLESDPGSWFGHIVPGTGTGGFAGWSGSARIVHDGEGPYFEIRLS